MRRGKIEWNALLICEMVFGFIGAMFTAFGVIFGVFIEDIAKSPNAHGDVRVLPLIFGSIGIFFLLVSAVLFVIGIQRKIRRRKLIESGNYIHAVVCEIALNYHVQINNRHPYYIICEGENPYTGERFRFRSADMMKHPGDLLGQYLRVYLDFANPKRYYVEVYRSDED